MGSARFGMVADALSQGLGLFAGKRADEEREKAEREWREALAATAERNSMARETRQYARSDELRAQDLEAATARQESQDARATERDRLTAENRRQTLEQGASQFEIDRADKEVRALEKQLADRYESAQKQIEKAGFMDETAADRIMTEYGNYRNRKIEALVVRLGKRNAPGFSINDAGAFESKLIELGMPTDDARFKTNELAPTMWPEQAPGTPLRVGQEGAPVEGYTGSVTNAGQAYPGAVTVPALIPPGASPPATTAAAGSRPVDMLGDAGTIPPAGATNRIYNQSFLSDLFPPGAVDRLKGGPPDPNAAVPKPGVNVPYGTRNF